MQTPFYSTSSTQIQLINTYGDDAGSILTAVHNMGLFTRFMPKMTSLSRARIGVSRQILY